MPRQGNRGPKAARTGGEARFNGLALSKTQAADCPERDPVDARRVRYNGISLAAAKEGGQPFRGAVSSERAAASD